MRIERSGTLVENVEVLFSTLWTGGKAEYYATLSRDGYPFATGFASSKEEAEMNAWASHYAQQAEILQIEDEPCPFCTDDVVNLIDLPTCPMCNRPV